MVELARVRASITAPIDRIWDILIDFAHPQRLARSIERCEVRGSGVGAVRVVTARGMTIHERLEAVDETNHRLSYRALPTGQMPATGVNSYLATVSLRRLAGDLTEIEWWSDGEIDAPAAIIQAHFSALYERAIENVRADAQDAAGRSSAKL